MFFFFLIFFLNGLFCRHDSTQPAHFSTWLILPVVMCSPQFQEQTHEVIKVTFSERVSGCVWGRTEEVSEHDEIDECDWMASASLAGKATDCKTVEVCDGCGTSSESLLSCTSSQFGPELERVIVPLIMKENVEDVRLVSSRHARKRQRKMASKLRLRF